MECNRPSMRLLAVILMLSMTGCKATRHTIHEQDRKEVSFETGEKNVKADSHTQSESHNGINWTYDTSTDEDDESTTTIETFDSTGNIIQRVTHNRKSRKNTANKGEIAATSTDSTSTDSNITADENKVSKKDVIDSIRNSQDTKVKSGTSFLSCCMALAVIAIIMILKRWLDKNGIN